VKFDEKKLPEFVAVKVGPINGVYCGFNMCFFVDNIFAHSMNFYLDEDDKKFMLIDEFM